MSSWSAPAQRRRIQYIPPSTPVPTPSAIINSSTALQAAALDALEKRTIIPRQHSKSNITNIYINFTDNPNEPYMTSYNRIYAALDVTVTYVSDFSFLLHIVVREKGYTYDGRIILYIHSNTEKGVYNKIELSNVYDVYKREHSSIFSLKKDEEEGLLYQIPKIIHQSYKEGLRFNNYKATSSWKNMNPDFEYRYWTDKEVETFLKERFDDRVWEAYDKLYAGAFRSDIYRLCILYEYGGVWIDISAVCEFPLRCLIEKQDKLIVPIDAWSERMFFIYQAFIITHPKSDIIKFVLDYTVDRVLNYEMYNINYSVTLRKYRIDSNDLSVTGPGIFGIALNLFLQRNPDLDFNIPTQSLQDHHIKLLHKNDAYNVVYNATKIITVKYPKYEKDRYNQHYRTLFENRLFLKEKVLDICPVIGEKQKHTIFHINLTSRYVLKNVFSTLSTWTHYHSMYHNRFITESEFVSDISSNQRKEFDGLLSIYQSITSSAAKKEIIKLYYLYQYGGFYADNNIHCLRDCTPLLEQHDIVLCRDSTTNNISTDFMGAIKNQPLLLELLHHLVDNNTTRDSTTLQPHIKEFWTNVLRNNTTTSLRTIEYTTKLPYFWSPAMFTMISAKDKHTMIGYDNKTRHFYFYRDELLYYNDE